MMISQRLAPCLWFDDQAEEAVGVYLSIFRNSRIVDIARYGEAGYEMHQRPAGPVMAIAFELDGQAFSALNGGPIFRFNEAVSWQTVPGVLFEMTRDPKHQGSQRVMETMLRMKKLDIDTLKQAYAG